MPTINNELFPDGTGAAGLGAVLGNFFRKITEFLTKSNNLIMNGNGANKDYWGIKLLEYLKEGGFVAFDGVDLTEVSNTMTGMLLGTAINSLWRSQKVGIVGGLPCGADQGIGLGPKEFEVCRDGTAWYIYHWEEQRQLGGLDGAGVIAPHGMDKLGKGDYSLITYKDVILSSLAAWDVAGLDYTEDTGLKRVKDAIETGDGKSFGPSWEGIFNIPVCNVENVPWVGDFDHKDEVLTPYGEEEEPRWCGPICSIDQVETDKFLISANMENFDDNPKDHCRDKPKYATDRYHSKFHLIIRRDFGLVSQSSVSYTSMEKSQTTGIRIAVDSNWWDLKSDGDELVEYGYPWTRVNGYWIGADINPIIHSE